MGASVAIPGKPSIPPENGAGATHERGGPQDAMRYRSRWNHSTEERKTERYGSIPGQPRVRREGIAFASSRAVPLFHRSSPVLRPLHPGIQTALRADLRTSTLSNFRVANLYETSML